MSPMPPSRELELSLCGKWGIVVGMDEVGRGAIAGPVCVGAVAVRKEMPTEPYGLTDSKLLTPKKREALVPTIESWALGHAVGWASPEEIDQFGIISALRLAGHRAVADISDVLSNTNLPNVGGILLDGNHNWMEYKEDLFTSIDVSSDWSSFEHFPVHTQTKADLKCVAVSAASIIAKVTRDKYMESVEDPGYHWAQNKGYASKVHISGLSSLGVSNLHRRSWKLPIGSQK